MNLVLYLPIVTTVAAGFFAFRIWRRWKVRGGTHHLWWSIGVTVYGIGTLAESWMGLFGWSEAVFKLWYVAGALLGGAPLAQGTVWFLMEPERARRLTIVLVVVATVASACVIASPVAPAAVEGHLPSGRAFAWQWVRGFSPLLNAYAVLFLVGGAFYSALRWRRELRAGTEEIPVARDRMIGNLLIAVGAILPAVGGTASRAGHTEVLYVTELAGILLIWTGFWLNVRKRPDGMAGPVSPGRSEVV